MPCAALIAEHYGLPHSVRRITREEFEQDIPRILDAMDQPSVDGVNTWFAAKAAAERGYKVVLSGVGGDELFYGYNLMKQLPRSAMLGRAASAIPGGRSLVGAACSILANGHRHPKLKGIAEFMGSLEGVYYLKRCLFLPQELPLLMGEERAREGLERLGGPPPGMAKANAVNDAAGVCLLDSTLYLRNQLLRDSDWASMAHSLELRTPLVDAALLDALKLVSHGFFQRIRQTAAGADPGEPAGGGDYHPSEVGVWRADDAVDRGGHKPARLGQPSPAGRPRDPLDTPLGQGGDGRGIQGRTMRILHFIPSIDPATGGPIEGLRQRCTIYRNGGYEVEVASLDSPEFVQQCDFPAKVVGLGPGWGVYAYSRHAMPWLKANLSRFDVVFVNGIWNYNTVAAHRALAGTEIPWAVFPHGMLDPYFKMRYPFKHIKKVIYWHGLLRRVLRDATAVLFTCEEEKIQARRSFSRYSVREMVVPYGTFGPDCDTGAASEEFLARWPELRGKRVAISLGRIHPKKGTDILIKAYAATLGKDAAWRLAIVGPDQLGWRKELEPMAARLGIADRITLDRKPGG